MQQKRFPSSHHDSFGFTLIELLLALTVFGILASLATPNLFAFLRDQRIESASNTLASQIKYTQSEAIKSSTSTIICITPNSATSCSTASSSSWDQGWTIFRDIDGDNAIDAGETLNTHGSLENLAIATVDEDGNNTNTKRITFSPQGVSSYAGNFVLKGENDSEVSTTLILLQSGQIISTSG